METALNKILNAREKRAELRHLITKDGVGTLSLCLNIAGFPKSNSSTKAVFGLLIKELEIHLKSNRIALDFQQAYNEIDDAGHWFVLKLNNINTSVYAIKAITEDFESKHPLGRLLDVDIYDSEGKPISSGKKKHCIICGNRPAVECMRQHNHELADLRVIMFRMIDDYVEKSRMEALVRMLVEASNKALHYEFLLSPKPGLVDFYGSGSHTDMNHYTFINTAAALTTYWRTFAEAGINYQGELKNALKAIRQIGLSAEEAMFKASGNVNTQKGAIFIFGISIFTCAFQFKKEKKLDFKAIQKTIQLICADLVENELNGGQDTVQTHGEETYKKYGNRGAGARWEAQNGFPIIFDDVLAFLESKELDIFGVDRENIDSILIESLLRIMSQINDSNILFRCGEEKLNEVKKRSIKSLQDMKYYNDLCEYCIKENISPGGSADMLALALFFFFIKKQKVE